MLFPAKTQNRLGDSTRAGLMTFVALSCCLFLPAASARNYYQQDNRHSSNYSSTPRMQFDDVGQYQQNSETSIITVEKAETGAHVILGGTVVPGKEVTLRAQVPGRVMFIAGQEGDWFYPGQVLVALNDDGLMAKRRQAMAGLYGTEARYRNSQLQYSREFWAPHALENYPGNQTAPSMGWFPTMFERFMGMGGGNSNPYPNYSINPWVIRDVDLYSQGTNISQAKSQIYGGRARIQEVDSHIRDTRAISPFEGVITSKLVEIGDTVQPGQPLVKFSDSKNLQLKVDVPARLVSALDKGMVVPAKLDVGNTYVDVSVAQIYPSADSQRHTVAVKFDLPSGAPGGPGMYAEVMVPDTNTPIRDMPIIPTSAIVQRGSLPSVFVVNQQNQAELRLVRLVDQVDRTHVAVLSGIRPGERIYVYPPSGIRSGWQPK